MEISPLKSHVHASDLPLEQLAKNTSLTEDEKVSELSRQFEAVLLRQILSDVRKTVISSKLTPQSPGSDIYSDMTTTQLADCISKSGSFGFAKSLEHELSRQVLHGKSTKEVKHEK
ncbi:MAG TPA: rod-binding protein [Verrucomicrobiae bacterium]